MARRSRSSQKSKSNTAVYIIVAAAVLGALVVGKIILDKRAQHFSNLSELSITDFQNNANSLSGNEYRVSGKIVEKLKWTSDRGQLISLATEQGDGEEGVLGIMVPAGIDQVNLEKGHSYTFKVEINREGLPVALDVKAK
ncbi:hypothetical protein JIN77_03915 [Verrucomicrobiaceae bacterium R5-34]|uniref:Uncharacterized protein n=1 Tax=Oceaniferula flava TaxID=2800421 RepID=A0AAE2SH93_9BACT|nr:hypothetical protein [Oceaniferula flavus]MBK1829857.1 hypothetical protein [Verrucomicrobiaceae bacterium R5-34]MBK1856326.1 hypothetical protein [Oceaniferula flavus]MBM1137633.1 hypothetical protein [Oceaniferula flavus]